MKKNNQFRAFKKRVRLLFSSRLSELKCLHEHYVNHFHDAFANYCHKMLVVTICHVVFNLIIVLLHFMCY